MRWQIILGGWDGTRSLIIQINSEESCSDESHSKNDFDTLKGNFQVIVAEQSITIKNHDNGAIFMKCSDEKISKSELTYMSVSSGKWQNSGNLQIEKIESVEGFS